MIFRKWFDESTDGDFTLQALREQILNRVLRVAALVTAPLYLLVLAAAIQAGNLLLSVTVSLLFGCLVLFALLARLPYAVKAHSILTIVFLSGLLRLFSTGLNAEAGLILLAYVLLATFLFGLRRGMIALGIVMFSYATIGFAMRWSLIPRPGMEAMPDAANSADWLIAGLVFTILISILGYALHRLQQGFDSASQRHAALTHQFEEERSQLEQKFTEQAQRLEKHSHELEAAGIIAHELAKETQMDALLGHSPVLIQSHFGYYHAGIFLLDEHEEYAVLQATNSEGGRKMIAEGHRLRKGEEGIVGVVVASGKPRIALDVGLDAVHFKNPYLPETRSEIALPLKAGDRVIGALDVQSTEAAAFAQDDITILQTIADQLAVAIERARQTQRMQVRMEELESAARQFTQHAWQSYLSSRQQSYGYCSGSGALTDHAVLSAEAKQAIRIGQPVAQTDRDAVSNSAVTKVAVPIKLRDQTLGVLTVRFNSPSVTPAMLTLISATTERMALSLETARLLEEIQVRAEREHVISDISAKVRGATNIENILQTTAVELGRKLGLRDVLVQLQSEEEA